MDKYIIAFTFIYMCCIGIGALIWGSLKETKWCLLGIPPLIAGAVLWATILFD